MLLFHGSSYDFADFDLSFARPGRDFGKGIYLTSNYNQALKWATKRGAGFIYHCNFDENIFDNSNDLKIRALTEYNKEWLDMLCFCRINLQDTNDDLIYDRMADNTYPELSKTLRLYSNGVKSVVDTINKIKWRSVLNDQYCFKTYKALSLLEIIQKEEV